MIIDGHVHAARQFSDSTHILPYMDRCGVDKIVLCPSLKNNWHVQGGIQAPFRLDRPDTLFVLNRLIRFLYRNVLKDQGDGNAFVHQLVSTCPERLLQFYWIDPLAEGCLAHLEHARQSWRVHGIKLHQACHPFQMDSQILKELFDLAGQWDLPVFVHLYAKADARRLLALAASFPNTTVIIGHLLGLEIAMEQNARLSNLFFDVSGGPLISPGRIQLGMQRLGDEHFVYGSDSPFADFKDHLEKIQQMDLSSATKERLLGGSLKALLKM